VSRFDDIWKQGTIREKQLRVAVERWQRWVHLGLWVPLVVSTVLNVVDIKQSWWCVIPFALTWPYPLWRWTRACNAHIACMDQNIKAMMDESKRMLIEMMPPELPPELLEQAQKAGRKMMGEPN
jgi:hypothetical protein